MSERPNDWDPMSEDIFSGTEQEASGETDRFIDELLAEKSTAGSEAAFQWYDLDLGGAEKPEDTGYAQPDFMQEGALDFPEYGGEQTAASAQAEAWQPSTQEKPGVEPLDRKPRTAAREKRGDRRAAQYLPPETEEAEDMQDKSPIRRRRQKKFGCLGGILYFLFVVGLSVILASVGWLWASDLLALGKEPVTAEITLPEEIFTEEEREVKDDDGNVTGTKAVQVADIDYVTDALKDAGLIKYKFLFKLFCSFSHAAEKLDPGTYELSTKFDYRALVYNMQEGVGERVIVKVTIPEGYTAKEIFQLLEEEEVCSAEKLLDACANYEFDYPFLEGLEYGAENRLEGYLFPDTYQFYKNEAPEDAISRLLDNFQNKFTSAMETEAAMLGYTPRQILTIASLIEKEAGSDAERATIASVIYNRLNSSAFPYLNIDATVQYVLPERKEKLTYADLEIDSPYNTYKYPGLPVGPISNPGLASIQAALNPEDTGYYFYALNKDGVHNFFTNSADHDAFINSEEFGG